MPSSDRPYDLDRIFRLSLTVGGGLLLFWLIRELADILVPFVVAILLAYLLNPLVTIVERRLKNRTVAVLAVVVGCGAVLLTAVVLVVPLVGSELGRFESIISQLRDQSSALAGRLRAALTEGGDSRLSWLGDRARDFLVSEDFRGLMTRASQSVVPTAFGVVTGVVQAVLGLIGLMIVVIYLVFLLIDYRLFARNWKRYLPPQYKSEILEFLDIFQSAMRRYFRGQFVIAAITGVLFATGFSLIDLPLAILLGLLIGLLNMVPYLQTIAILPAAILALLRAAEHQSSVLTSLALVALVFAVVQLVTDGLLAPFIMGPAVGLRPVVIMLSVFIWGRLLGFVGLVLAIPLTCLGLAYYRKFVLKGDDAAAAAAETTTPTQAA